MAALATSLSSLAPVWYGGTAGSTLSIGPTYWVEIPGYLVAAVVTHLLFFRLRKSRAEAAATSMEAEWRAVKAEKAEEALRVSEREFQELYDNMYISVDAQSWRVIRCNRAASSALGYPKEELIGLPALSLFHPRNQNDAKREFETFRQTGEAHATDIHLRRKDGSTIDVSRNISVIRDEQGAMVATQSILRDISERREAENALREANVNLEKTLAELQRAQEEIIQQERLRALGTMASGIAHDFNNALAPILGYSDLLLKRPDLLEKPAQVLQYLEKINDAATDGANVVSRMRGFYRHRDDTGVMAAIALNPVVEGAIGVTRPKWKDMAQSKGFDIDLRAKLADDLPLIAGNEAALRSALTNLIFNAVDAMPEGGVLTISTRAGDDNVVLEVRDTGTGMSAEVRRRAMEPFFTSKEERGSGLGLAIVQAVVQRHSGKIAIESLVGKGTNFVITLPTVEGGEEPTQESQHTEIVQGRRVLVVDDESYVRSLVSEYLTLDGNAVETAETGREGLGKFAAGTFDLVITDRSMPDMNGDEVARAIKEVAPGKQVIMLTGFGEMMEVAGEHPTGVDLTVTKLLTLDDLRAAMFKLRGQSAGDVR